jgi:hypothetical protein
MSAQDDSNTMSPLGMTVPLPKIPKKRQTLTQKLNSMTDAEKHQMMAELDQDARGMEAESRLRHKPSETPLKRKRPAGGDDDDNNNSTPIGNEAKRVLRPRLESTVISKPIIVRAPAKKMPVRRPTSGSKLVASAPNSTDLLLQKDKIIQDLRLELAETMAKLLETEKKLFETEKKLLEAEKRVSIVKGP